MGKNNHGFSDDHVEYLTHHSQEMHGPTDFDEEVQKHLDKLYSNKRQDTPPDFEPTPEDQYAQNQKDEQNALQNVAVGGPAKIPAPPSPTPGLPLRP